MAETLNYLVQLSKSKKERFRKLGYSKNLAFLKTIIFYLSILKLGDPGQLGNIDNLAILKNW